MSWISNVLRQIVAIALVLIAVHGLIVPSTQAAPAQATVEWLTPDQTSQTFKQAERPVPLEFPKDLGVHPAYQTEWWYYTGNLQTDQGRDFGYQFTIFRRALKPSTQVSSAEDWRTNQVYFAHFTVSDIENKAFYPQERFSRGAAHLAGAEANPYHIWINDWSMSGKDKTVHLNATGDQVAIDLDLEQAHPPVLQGDHGYSIKGPEPGNASYYYSIVQQPTSGTVQIGDETLQVTGTSWKDHEYSTSALSPGTAGWDWFSLQFDDGTALMVYALRQEDGTPLEFSKGNFIDRDGTTTPLTKDDWQLNVLKQWKSAQSGATYPAGWSLKIPKLDLSIQGQPLMSNQELNLSTVYWEGAVRFDGTRQESPVTAKGYVELTGYKESLTTLT